MGKIHTFQTALDITRTVGVDITGATETLLKYKKPSLAEGQWTATIDDAATGKVKYTVADNTVIDEYGTWIVWAKITFADSTVAESEATKMFVYKAGQL